MELFRLDADDAECLAEEWEELEGGATLEDVDSVELCLLMGKDKCLPGEVWWEEVVGGVRDACLVPTEELDELVGGVWLEGS